MMSDYDVENIADLLLTEYKYNKKNNGKLLNNLTEEVELAIPLVKKENYSAHDYLNPIIDIMELLTKEKNPYIKHALIHGSLQDMMYIPGWSDLDTWIVISDDIFQDKNKLLELRQIFTKLNKFLLNIDPIAHHGFILLLESDLANYDESIMPVAVLKKAKSLIGDDVVKIYKSIVPKEKSSRFPEMKILFENFNTTGEFNHHPYMGKNLTKDDFMNNEGMYQLKYLISLIMSVPILYFTEIGTPVYKSDSFELFSRSFSKYDNIIYVFSDIRKSWEDNENHPYVPNKIPKWVIKMIPKDFIQQIILLITKIEEDLSYKKKDLKI